MKNKLLLSFVFLCFLSISNGQNNANYVNLFVGTTDEGNMMPGATMPFGMVQLSPDTRIEKPSGYDYKDSSIIGFSHTHLSGTGLGDFGDVLTMPICLSNIDLNSQFPDFSSSFSHKKEFASPGYYSVFLENSNTNVELTATERCGFQKYSYSKKKQFQGIFVDLKHSIYGLNQSWIPDEVYDCQLTVEDNYTISGSKKSKGWAPQQNVYFVMKFNQPITQFFIKDKKQITKGVKHVKDSLIQAVFLFEKSSELFVKTGISATSIAGARLNLASEIPDWEFDKYKKNAKETWNNYLNKISIGATKKQKELFYTALYHTLLTPNLLSDVDGSFFGPDFKNHHSKYRNFYSTFSLWDTYRAVHPLYTIICPEKNAEFVNSMLTHFDVFGRLPIWTLWGTENYCMTGNPAIPVIVDACLKGNHAIDSLLAWKAISVSATGLFPRTTFDIQKNYGFTPSYWGEYGVRGDRNRYDFINKYGYLPHDSIRESCTSLLELCYDDWCVAQLAKKLGKAPDYTFFQNRSQYFKNIFDKETGYIRPRLANGNWLNPFSPYLLSDWKTGAFVEGNAAQYTFYVPHQVDTLISLCGGAKKFETKLDSLFSVQNNETDFSVAISGFLGQYAHGNEPSHHIAYLYNAVKRHDKTAEKVTEIMNTQYTTLPSGLCGNDDCGQMSAWYVFSALGFYPVNPADGKYWIGTSKFKMANINLDSGNRFKINYIGNKKNKIYVHKIELNNNAIPVFSLNHDDIVKGGVLNLYMGKNINAN